MKQLTLEDWERALSEVSGIPDKALRRILLRVRQRLDITTEGGDLEGDVTRATLVQALHKKRVLEPHLMRLKILQMLKGRDKVGLCYLHLYREFEHRTGISINQLRSGTRTGLQVVHDLGMMEEMYNMALEMYGDPQ